ncbi:MAG: DNA repair protein [Clostridia bacterium]|nr:DNA repair protein [Clostridia bacterium]
MAEKQRVYFVIDMKSFFASVECAERGLDAMTTDLVVADEERSDRTICLAVSPSMKAKGVKNRCRLYEIPKNLNYIIAKPRMKKYIEYAGEIYAIYLKYIDKNDIHVYSIDECILDVTDYLKIYKIKAKDFAKKLMNEIWENLGIPSSAGIGTNMYLAKIALDITAKHSEDRIGWLTQEKFIKTLWHHKPITDFWGISVGTRDRLSKFGIHDMAGIANTSEDLLYDEFGVNAELLIDHAFGRETCLMCDIKNYKSKSKSISNSQILPCNYSYEQGKTVIKEMIQEGCYRLAREHYSTSLIHIYLSYGDEFKIGAKGTMRMNETTNLYSIIGKYAEDLYDKIYKDKTRPVRRIAYDFSCLVSENGEQYDFFTDLDKVEKEKNLVRSVLNLKDKFGKNAVLKGLDLKEDATQRERNKMVGGHNG